MNLPSLPASLWLHAVENYRNWLVEQGLSSKTVENYLSDLRRWMIWFNDHPGLLDKDLTKAAEQYLEDLSANHPISTVNRRTAALRRFGDFLSQKMPLTWTLDQKLFGSTGTRPSAWSQWVDRFGMALSQTGCNQTELQNLVGDVSLFLSRFPQQDLEQTLTKHEVARYQAELQERGINSADITATSHSLRKFAAWATETGFFVRNPLGTWFDQLSQRSHFASLHPHRPQTEVLAKLPVWRQWYLAYHRLPFTTALHLAVLVVFASMLSVFAFRQFGRDVATPFAYPSAPVRPNRQLSFQGRLTDSVSTPITTATNVVFTLHDDPTAGNELWDSGICSVDPDQDGIFSTSLGGDCGSEIPEDVFSELADVWLEIEVGGETLSPRQHISSVPYALNTETVQGFPVSLGGEINTIPVINALGEMIIGASNPSIIASSGAFLIQGESLMFSSEAGNNITMMPGLGGTFTVSGPTNISGTLTASGTVTLMSVSDGLVRATSGVISGGAFVNLTTEVTGTLPIANGGTNSTALPTAGAVAYGTGTAYAFTAVGSSGECLVSGGTGAPTWNSCAGAVSSSIPWQVTNGTANLKNTTLDLLVGGDSTASAKFAFLNVNSGTPTASISAGTAGAYYFTASGSAQTTARQNLTLGGGTTGNILIPNRNNTPFITFDTVNSRLGIGTTNPGYSLDAPGTARLADITFSTIYQSWAGQGVLNANSGLFLRSLSGPVNIQDAYPGNVTIANGGGNVGIGANTPTSKLHVEGFYAGNALARFNETGGNDILTASSSGTTRFVIQQDGDVGIGVVNPVAKLDIAGGNIRLDTTQSIYWSAVGSTDTNTSITVESSLLRLKNYGSSAVQIYDTQASAVGITFIPSTGNITLKNGSSVLAFSDGNTAITGNASGLMRFSTYGVGAGWSFYDSQNAAIRLTVAGTGNITATGTITGLTGITSSGTITFSGLTNGLVRANSGVLSGGATVNLASEVTGLLSIANGGTNSSATPTAGGIAYGTGTAYAFTAAGASGECLLSAGGGSPTWGSCTTAVSGSIPWEVQNGAANLKNTTLDLLVGGNSSTSAKFAILNVNSGTPTASVSAGAAGAAFLTANGSLSTTARQPLVIGNSSSYNTTGNVLISPNGTGNVAIGTTTPNAAYKLDVNGHIRANDTVFADGGSFVTFNAAGSFLGNTTYGAGGGIGYGANMTQVWAGSGFPLVFGTAGTENMRLSAEGNLGVGTNAPTSKLHVEGFYGGNALARFNETGGNDILTASSSGTTRFRIDTNGNAALLQNINTAGSFRIHNSSSGANANTSIAVGNNTHAGFGFFRVNSSAAASLPDTFQMGTIGGYPIAFLTNNTEVMRIAGNGNVNIGGDTTPNALFNVGSTSQFQVNSSGAIAAATGITSSGTITFSGFSANGGLLYTNGSGVLAQTAVGANGECLISAGGGSPTWGSCSAAVSGVIPWQVTNGTANLKNTTLDLLVGGDSTASAKFAFINVNSGTPTASISAGVAGAANLTASGILGTTAGQDITLAPSGTARLTISNNGNVGIGTTTPSSKLEVSGVGQLITIRDTTAAVSDGQILGSFAFWNNDNGNPGANANISGVANGTAGSTSLAFYTGAAGAPSERVRILGTTGTCIGCMGIGTIAPNRAVEINSATGANLRLTYNDADGSAANYSDFSISSGGDLTIAPSGADTNITGNLAVSDSTTLGDASGDTVTVNSGAWTFANDTTVALTGGVNGLNFDSNTLSIDAFNNRVGIGTAAPTVALEVSGNARIADLLFSTIDPRVQIESGALRFVDASNNQLARLTQAGNFGIGSDTTPDSLFSVGSTSQFQVNSSGAIVAATGITSSGTITLSGLNVAGGVVYTNGSGVLASVAGSSGQCLLSNGTSAPSFGSCASGTTNYWDLQNGALFPVNSTSDFLLGGTATTSADFAVLNVNGSGPATASVSGNLIVMPKTGLGGNVGIGTLTPNARLGIETTAFGNEAIRITTAGGVGNVLSLTEYSLIMARAASSNQNLTIGTANQTWGATGGNVIFTPNGTERLRIATSGNVGIGTTTPTALLDVAGTASLSGTLAFRGTTDPKIDILNGENFGIRTSVGGDAGLSEKFTILNNGNVGIGTTSPAHALSVNGNISGTKIIATSFAPSGAELLNSSGATGILGAHSSWTELNLRTGGTTRLTILSSGNVGIGTTTPTSPLHVAGAYSNNAAAIINQLNSGDILTASASGTTRLRLTNGGDLILTGGDLQIGSIGLNDIGSSNVTSGASLVGVYDEFDNSSSTTVQDVLDDLDAAITAASSGSFDLAGDSGTPETISPGNTLSIVGGSNGIDTVVSATDTLTLNLDTTEIGTTTFGSGSGFTWTFNAGTTDPTIAFDDDELTLTAGDVILIGNVGLTGNLTSTGNIVNTGAFTNAGGAINLNASSNFAVNIGTGTTTSAVTLGGGSNDVIINSDTWDVSSGGAITGLTGITSSGTITFSGLSNGIVKATSGVLSGGNTVALASEVSGTLPIANGGTNSTATPTNGGVAYGTGTAYAFTAAGSSGECFKSNGATAPTWGSCTSGLTEYWGITAGALRPTNATTDLLIGGTATSSAKFAFTNVNSGTPTIRINDVVDSLYIAADGVVTATDTFTLETLGGNITLNPNSGSGDVIVAGDVNVSTGNAYRINGTSVLSNNTLGSGVTTSSLATVGALSSGSIASGFGTIATSNTITGTTLNGTTGINTGASAGTQRLDASGNLVNITNITASGTITFSGLSNGIVKATSGVLSGGNTVALGSEVTGTLPITNGGTNSTATPTNGGIAYGTGTAYAFTSAGTSGQCLQSNGAAAPTWGACDGVITNYWQLNNTHNLSASNLSYNILLGNTATSSANIALNADGSAVFNEQGLDRDFRIETDSLTHAFFVDASTDRIGFGTSTPDYQTQFHAATGQADFAITTDVNVGSANTAQMLFISDYDGTPSYSSIGQYNTAGLRLSSAGNLVTPDMFINSDGAVLIGGLSETLSNSGYVMDGPGDLYVAGMAGIEGNVYTDGSFVAGASTTYGNGTISQSSGETLTLGTTAAGLTLQTTTSGNIILNSAGSIELQDNTNVTGNLDVSGTFTAGTADAFSINSSGAITAATGITSSGTITLSGLSNGFVKVASGVLSGGNTISLTSDITGTLPIANGGTNSTATPTNGGIAYGTGTAYAFTSAGTSGQCLQSNGAAAPSWGSCLTGNLDLFQLNNTHNVSPANLSYNILLGNTATSSANIALNADGSAVFNEQGLDRDFRIEGDTDANLLMADASTDRIGIGVSAPAAKLHSLATTEQLRLGYNATNYAQFTVQSNGDLNINAVASSGTPKISLADDLQLATGNVLDNTGDVRFTFGTDLMSVNEQLRVTYDPSNYTSFVPSSGGDLTITPTGGDVIVDGTFNARTGLYTGASAGTLRVDASGNFVNVRGINKGTTLPTSTDLGLYSEGEDNWVRFVANGGYFAWWNDDTNYTDGYDGAPAISTSTMSLSNTGLLNLTSGGEYRINNASVLTATTLGSSVVNSSLTSVGTLTNLTVAGNLTVDTTTLFVNASTNQVGINTNGSATALEINHASGNNLRLTYNDSDGSAANYADFLMNGSGTLTIDASGNHLTINHAASVNGQLDVSGKIFIAGEIESDGSEMLLDTGGFGVGIDTIVSGYGLEINHATGNNLRLTYNDSDGSAANYSDFLISSSGDLTITPSGGDIGLNGLLTVSGGLVSSGGNSSLNVNSSTNTTAIATGTTTGAVTIGGGSNTLAINTTTWDISTAGVATGFTGITTSGTFTATGTVSINDNASTNTISIGGGTTTGAINLGTGGSTQILNIGATGSGIKTVSIGSNISTSTTWLGAGSGGLLLNETAGTSPTNIGTGTTTGAITIGGTGTQTLNIGNGAGVKTVVLGSTNTTSATTLNAGSGGWSLNTPSITWTGFTDSTTNRGLCISAGGVITRVASAGIACSTSSIRFKDEVQNLQYGLAEVLQLRPITFKYKEDYDPDDRSTHLGFVAEEVGIIVPELVTRDTSGVIDGVQYSQFTSLLARGIQQFYGEFQTYQSTMNNQIQTSSLNTSGTITAQQGHFSALNVGGVNINGATGSLTVPNLKANNAEVKQLTVVDNSGIVTASITPNGSATFRSVVAQEMSSRFVSAESMLITGNATVEGTLTAQSARFNALQATGATVSGTLQADRLIGLISADSVEGLEARISALVTAQTATLSGTPAPDPDTQGNINTLSQEAGDGSTITLPGDLVINGLLQANGGIATTTLLVDTTAVTKDSLSFAIEPDCDVETGCNTFALQPSGEGTLTFLNNLVVMSDGSVTINGDLTVNGKIAAEELQTESIITGGENLTINLAGAQDEEGGDVLGQLIVNGSAHFQQLTLDAENAEADEDNEDQSEEIEASSGTATITSGRESFSIRTSAVKSNSLIYLTATSATDNKVLFVESQEDGEFKVSIDGDSHDEDISFNWWVIGR